MSDENGELLTRPVAQRLAFLIASAGFSTDKLSMADTFEHDIGMDSMDYMELITAAEIEFGIEIPSDVAEKITTFGHMVRYLEVRTS